MTCDLSLDELVFQSLPTSRSNARYIPLLHQDDAAAARTLLVEMMADLDEEVAELFLMEEEVRALPTL